MILEPKKTTLAYRCPACGYVTTSLVGAFSLSGDMFKLKCSCGESLVIIEKGNDDMVNLTVPCVACPKPHYFTLSSNLFFSTDIFMLPCPLCGIDLCFIGKEKQVSQAIERSNEEISAMLGDYTIDQIKSSEAESLLDPQVYDIVKFVISELNDEGNIHCLCQDGKGEYDCSILPEGVSIKCRKCNAKKDIEITGTIAAQEFLNNTNEITLK